MVVEGRGVVSAEPCSICQTKAWYEWSDDRILRGEGITFKPKICDACRERLGRLAAQYQPKEGQHGDQ